MTVVGTRNIAGEGLIAALRILHDILHHILDKWRGKRIRF